MTNANFSERIFQCQEVKWPSSSRKARYLYRESNDVEVWENYFFFSSHLHSVLLWSVYSLGETARVKLMYPCMPQSSSYLYTSFGMNSEVKAIRKACGVRRYKFATRTSQLLSFISSSSH